MTATLVLVHGAWHGPQVWAELIEALGPDVPTRTVALPSAGTDPGTLGDLSADADAVRAVLAGIDGPVVVLAHSYGGQPVTEAVTAGVAHIVYLAAFALDVGESLLGVVGGQAPPWWEVHDTYVVANDPENVFYNDVDPERTAAAVAALRLQSMASVNGALTRTAWADVPSTYVVCDRDQAIPPFAQEAMAARAGTVLHLDAGHSPFLSRPADLAALVRPLL